MPTTPPAEAGTAPAEVEALAAALLDRLHETQPLRVWSLIVTIFGDLVAPRGGEVWAGTLSDLLGLMRIDAAAVRAALSRLARDGWVERERQGRLSFYALSAAGRATFTPASQRIYRLAPDGGETRQVELRVVVLPETDGRSGLREAARKAGYGLLAPGVLLGTPASPPLDGPDFPQGAADGAVTLAASVLSGSDADLVARAFDLAPLAGRYQSFCRRYAPLAEALEAGQGGAEQGRLSPETAMVCRILLVHDYRRLILRDPMLPPALLPADWPGLAANRLAARLYGALRAPAEAWIAAHARGRDGALPPPDASEIRRFSAG